MRRLARIFIVLAVSLGFTLTVSPALACGGYYDCQEYEFGYYCVFYPG